MFFHSEEYTSKNPLSMLLSFNSSVGGMTFENQFLQMSSLLPSDVLYGLGEHSAPLLLDVKWQRASLFARDVATPEVRRETEFLLTTYASFI